MPSGVSLVTVGTIEPQRVHTRKKIWPIRWVPLGDICLIDTQENP